MPQRYFIPATTLAAQGFCAAAGGVWYFAHLLDKIFTLEKINLFIFFSLNQIFLIFAAGLKKERIKVWKP